MLNKTHLINLCGAILIGSSAVLSTPVYAANEAMLDLLKILGDKGSISNEEYALLTSASKADGEKVEGKLNEFTAEVEKKTKDLPEISTKGKLELKDKDGNKFRIGGRLQADTTFGGSDVNFEGSEGGSPVTEFRRARMYLSGVFQHDWKFKLQYDFADDQSGTIPNTDGIKDAYIAYTGFKPVEITLGHHKMPLSMEELTSSKYITFIERSQLVNGIVADTGGGRQYGLSAQGYFSDMFTASGGMYAGSANEDDAENAFGFTGRLTFSPIHEKTRMVHLGVGFNHHKDHDGGLNIDAEPEVHPGADILETESGGWTQANTFVVETAGIYESASVQFEYALAELEDSPTSVADADTDAWYVYGSYYLTGESRNYNWKSGSYKQTKVKNPLGKGGFGAWEVALRYTSGEYDNTDGTATGSSDADIFTAGLNWYPINNVRFSGNYVSVLDASPDADSELAGDLDAGSTADDASYFALRAQWYF